MEELFKKVYIKSEADLPKDKGYYFVGYKDAGKATVHYHHNNEAWIAFYDWYLQPIQPEPLSQRRTAEGIMPNILTIFSEANKLPIYDFYEWINPYLKELEKYTK
jgi:hypothetical protein